MSEGGSMGHPPMPRGPFLREYVPQPGFRHTSARTASVVFYRGGGYSVMTMARAEHFGRRMMARPQTVCEIALGTFTTRLELELPAQGGATFFAAEVEVHWAAADPYLVATNVVEDVEQRLKGPVLQRLRDVTSQYPVTDSGEAEKRLTAYCADGRWDDLGSGIGLSVRLYVRLRTDQRRIEEHHAFRDEQHQAALQGMREKRMLTMLRGGQLDKLAFMLASSPEDARDFMERIRQEGRQDEKERIKRVIELIEGGKVHSVELEQQVLDELNRGPYQVRGSIGPAPTHRGAPAPAADAPADDVFTPEWVVEDAAPGTPGTDGTGSIWGDGPGAGQARQDRAGDPAQGRGARGQDDGWTWADES
jgi:hypothetical protein